MDVRRALQSWNPARADPEGAILAKTLMDMRRLRKSLPRRQTFAQRIRSHAARATPIDQMTLGPVRGAAEAIEDLHVTANVRDDGFWIKLVYGPAFALLGPDQVWTRDRITELVT